ncbi:MAG: hypothetical protein L0211_22945 [Planctomycetaceae bacterium]|nr:hypothetical protein [Planctomycetaceae bacterium]
MAGKLGGWQPTEIERFIESRDTACNVMLVDTDAGRGYLKAMGNPAGNHSLVCEWLGTNLARRLGLSTFDMALIEVAPDDVLYFARGGRAAAGPAVISRAESGQGWGGSVAELRGVENAQQIARVVVLDTWLRNQDRHHPSGTLRNYDNVFLSAEAQQAGKLALRAIDHSHCLLASPTPIVTLNAHELRSAALREDPSIYGFFPEFRDFCDLAELDSALADLAAFNAAEAGELVSDLPAQWQVSGDLRQALMDFLVARSQYVADTMKGEIARLVT